MKRGKKKTKRQLEKILTEKQKRFSHAYIQRYNGTQAAIKAGYSEATACLIASQNIRKLYIRQYIDYIKDDIAKEVGISKIGILNELRKMAFSNISDLKEDWETNKDWATLKAENPDALAAIQETDTKVVKINQEDSDPLWVEHIKVKMHDKTKPLLEMLKVMGWYENEQIKKQDTAIILEFGGGIGMDQYKNKKEE